MRSILELSKPLRKQWESGDLMIEGAVYDITTGKVEFIGSPKNVDILEPTEQQIAPLEPIYAADASNSWTLAVI
eukprot:CAMPEP_0172671272 /NCGR_PEP_ID=MMETSP1074-20121228/10815_1 /TAXON_ID=2916 /ORGANISM="Ceratium fusus, Strain PA161109" /LENGTH=73 /DNA_ID=CAMNT_0013488293 /DNA_START=14 /DNA_END=236 /DNA_ORIENTATION=-